MLRVIYLDHNATTPVHPAVLESMLPYFNIHFGNPSSSFHPQSWTTAGAVKNARTQVAKLFNCDSSEIIFTSGATESINLSLKGLWAANPSLHLITSNIEHPATQEVARWAEKNGKKVTLLNVKPNGLIDISDLEKTLSLITGPKLVSLLWAHNEIGSLYNIDTICQLKNKYDFLLHLDGTQALLTEDIDTSTQAFDLMSFSAHKIYGPKGVGGLFLRKKTVGHQLEPLINGGGQEFGLRSGTLNVPGIVGLGTATDLVSELKAKDKIHFLNLTKIFFDLLKAKNLEVIYNGDHTHRIYQNINITLPEVYAPIHLMSHLSGFCLSQGSACASEKTSLNPTLSALGLNEGQMKRTLRIGLGRNTTVEDLELFVDKLANVVN